MDFGADRLTSPDCPQTVKARCRSIRATARSNRNSAILREARTLTPLQPVLDGHNDVLLRLHLLREGDPVRLFLEGRPDGHLDLPRMVEGGFAGGFFAAFVPSLGRPAGTTQPAGGFVHDVPLPAPLDQPAALATALQLIDLLVRIEAASDGRVAICRDVRAMEACLAAGRIAAILHLEGAEPIGPDLAELDRLYALGLRSIGPVWSRPNAFAHGVPFRFPSGPDTGPGLTEAGRALVRRCNALRILIDLSHLNEAGFWDVAGLSDAPLVATHSNAHAVTPHSRNLTDRQLDAIAASGGLVGVNFAASFLRADARPDPATRMEDVLRHLDHLVSRLGLDGVAIGSDFDGAIIPSVIGSAAGLPNLVSALRAHGYDADAVDRIARRNWLRVLRLTWGA